MHPIALGEHMARQIVLVQPLHDDDPAGLARNASGAHGQVPPLQYGLSFLGTLRLPDIVGIIAHDAIGVLAAAVAPHRGREPVTAMVRLVVRFLVLVSGQAKFLLAAHLIPWPAYQGPAPDRVAGAELLIVGGKQPPDCRIQGPFPAWPEDA